MGTKLSLMVTACTAMLIAAPIANAVPGDVLAQAPGPYVAQQQDCDPNYSGACVPIASDVDCASGGGNGPAYVQGPVTVVGDDIYGLDRDGNGTGCES
jgi:hypothetical protein